MARRIVRKRIPLRGAKARKRRLKLLELTITPGPPPATTPNKDFYVVKKLRSRPKRHRKIRRDRHKRAQQTLQLLKLASHPSSVLMPEVENILLPAAQAILSSKGLIANLTYQPSLVFPFNTVLKQSPVAGTSLAVGSTVALLVSSGWAILPNEVGQPIDQATSDLVALGVLPKVSEIPTSSVAPGIITRQVPSGGQKVLVGSSVFLTVAVAPPPGAARAQLPSLQDIVVVTTQVK